MKDKLTILVDMDDTIEDLCGAWTSWLNREYGTSVSPEDIKEWDITKAFPELTPDQIYSPLSIDEFWKTVQPIPGAKKVLKKLKRDGHNVIILTSASASSVYPKLTYCLFDKFPMFSRDDVIIAKNKQLIKGDVLIDDYPKNLERGSYRGILFSAPHNQYYDTAENGMKRARTWQEVYVLIQKIIDNRRALSDILRSKSYSTLTTSDSALHLDLDWGV